VGTLCQRWQSCLVLLRPCWKNKRKKAFSRKVVRAVKILGCGSELFVFLGFESSLSHLFISQLFRSWEGAWNGAWRARGTIGRCIAWRNIHGWFQAPSLPRNHPDNTCTTPEFNCGYKFNTYTDEFERYTAICTEHDGDHYHRECIPSSTALKDSSKGTMSPTRED
jgi:hypothetical protein